MLCNLRAALLGSILVTSLFASPAKAGWDEFWEGMKSGFHRNNCWPEPFIQADRSAARQAFGVMIANGWQQELTLASYHFDPETNQLNSAGEARLQWILTQVPEHVRNVFVLQSLEEGVTNARMAAVHQRSAQFMPGQPAVNVMVTNTAPRGGRAEHIDSIHRQFREQIPAPTLPEFQAAGSSTNQ